MDTWRYVVGVQPGHRARALVASSLLAVSLLAPATRCRAEQGQRPQERGGAVPSFDSLPSAPFPAGEFGSWCGEKIVMVVDDRRLIYDDKGRPPSYSFLSRSKLNCDDDGQRLVQVDHQAGWPEKTGSASEIEIASGLPIRKIATYQRRPHQIVSFSPDLKNVASTEPLNLAPGTGDLKVIELRVSEGRGIRHVGWSSDSSKVFAVSEPQGKSNTQSVEVFNAQRQKIGSGPLPKGLYFRNGWFANGRALYLYLGSNNNEFGTGFVFKCSIDAWKCVLVAKDVLEASVGGDGMLGTVRPVGKYSNNGDWMTIPPQYLVEIRNSNFQVVARQAFKSAERGGLGLAIAPSGTKVALTWVGEIDSCPAEKQKYNKCYEGIVIDLSGRPK
jgi:hypothetical protein